MMLKGYRKVHSVSSKCNALTASYAMICKVACCRSHLKNASEASQMRFLFYLPHTCPTDFLGDPVSVKDISI